MKRFFHRVRFLFTLHKSIPFLVEFFISKEMKLSKKLLFIILILGYIMIPFDVIPDFLAIFGVLDDIGLALLLLQLMVKVAPDSLKKKYKNLS